MYFDYQLYQNLLINVKLRVKNRVINFMILCQYFFGMSEANAVNYCWSNLYIDIVYYLVIIYFTINECQPCIYINVTYPFILIVKPIYTDRSVKTFIGYNSNHEILKYLKTI